MSFSRVSLACFALVFASASAHAQQQRRATAVVPTVAAQQCLKALDGSCTNPDMVEAARLRAVVISSVRVSYFGTPAGEIGGPLIPFERLFRDNDVLFGLPTSTCVACVTRRTK